MGFELLNEKVERNSHFIPHLPCPFFNLILSRSLILSVSPHLSLALALYLSIIFSLTQSLSFSVSFLILTDILMLLCPSSSVSLHVEALNWYWLSRCGWPLHNVTIWCRPINIYFMSILIMLLHFFFLSSGGPLWPLSLPSPESVCQVRPQCTALSYNASSVPKKVILVCLSICLPLTHWLLFESA